MKISLPKDNVPAYSFNTDTYKILNDTKESCNHEAIMANVSKLKTDIFWNMYGMARAVFECHVMPLCLKHGCSFISDRTGFVFMPNKDGKLPEAEIKEVSQMLLVSTGLDFLTKIGNMMPSFNPHETGQLICGTKFYHYLMAIENDTVNELKEKLQETGFYQVEEFKTEDDCNKYFFHYHPAAVGHFSPFDCILASAVS